MKRFKRYAYDRLACCACGSGGAVIHQAAVDQLQWSKIRRALCETFVAVQEIRNDITRTYPDLEFFRRENTQTLLTRVLFIWVKLHPELGYR